MATAQLGTLVRHIHKLAAGSRNNHQTDRELLDNFTAGRDESAFSALVARHGPMVLRVCRRVLGHEQDAEDAFQATFLVLAKNNKSIRRGEALGGWLHGVAYRTAMKAKRSAARRRKHEARSRDQTACHGCDSRGTQDPAWSEVRVALDEEIQALPVHYRSAFVACVLESKSVPEAAAELAYKAGTVSSWLARARSRLRQRLARRGIELTALLAALSVAESTGRAAVPAALAHSTIRFGLSVAAGNSAVDVIPTHIAALAVGVTRALFLSKAKIAIAIVLSLSLLGVGTQSAGRRNWTKVPAEAARQQDAVDRSGVRTKESQEAAKSKTPPKKETDPPVVLDRDDPLDVALLRWQKAIDKIATASCKLTQTNKDVTFKLTTVFEGSFKYMKPKQWILELQRKDKADAQEKSLRNGATLYRFEHCRKEIHEFGLSKDDEFKLELPGTLVFFQQLLDHGGYFGFLTGMKPEEAKRRYNLAVTKGKEKDPYYIYMDISPRREADKADFLVARLVLNKETHLPRQFWLRHPNGDETTWDIPKIETGVEFTADDFKLTVPKGWRLKKLTSPRKENE
jgi:TIGR03009 family protein